MSTHYDLHIVAIVEKGYLEQQCRLLVLSIEQFVKPHLNVKVIVCSPRAGRAPEQPFIEFLHQYEVDFIDKPLNQDHDYFPLCNGIYACDYVARTYHNIHSMLLVDTDTLFFNAIDKNTLRTPGIHVRPVDNKGIGSTGIEDKNDTFWQQAYNLFDLKSTHPNVTTTVSQEVIRPYYNSGFILVNQQTEFFIQWKKDFIQLMDANIRTSPSSSRHQVDYGFIEQMVISITCEKQFEQTHLLPEIYNYPIPFRPRLKNRDQHFEFEQLVHVHYHRWFQHPGFLDYVTTDKEKQSAQYQWLKNQLPLMPEISGPFKC